MLFNIEITQLPKQSIRYQPDRVLTSHNFNQIKHKGEESFQQNNKQFVPMKQYSNKFLRESASKDDKNQNENSRLNLLINKHKSFQKKYQRSIKKGACKTEPNQNQYQCFQTSKNFYKITDPQATRIKTQSMTQNKPLRISQNSRQQTRNKNADHVLASSKEEKISTSRALELFAKVVSKDKADLLEKVRICTQQRLQKDQLNSKKNLEAKQVILLEKVQNQQKQRKLSTKTSVKFRNRKKSDIHNIFRQQDSFEIKGWDFPI